MTKNFNLKQTDERTETDGRTDQRNNDNKWGIKIAQCPKKSYTGQNFILFKGMK